MFHPDALLDALILVFTWKTMLWIAIGVAVGVGASAFRPFPARIILYPSQTVAAASGVPGVAKVMAEMEPP